MEIDLAAVEWGRDFAAELGEVAAELSVFPTLEGGLLLERQSGGSRWSLEIDSAGEAFITTVSAENGTTDSEIDGVAEAIESYNGFPA